MSTLPIADRVQRGAQLLDEQFPGWTDEVDISTLNLASACNCILGQKFGDFHVGARRTHLAVETRGVVLGDASQRLLQDHGFLVSPRADEMERLTVGRWADHEVITDKGIERIEAEYVELTEAWAKLITDRRAAVQLAEVTEPALAEA